MINMDDSIDYHEEGFQGQLLYRIPDRVVERFHRQPFLKDFVVTDLGWFPLASRHRVERKTGLNQNVLLIVESGSGWGKWGTHVAQLSAGQAFLIPSGHSHSYGADETDPWSLFWFHFEGVGARGLIDYTGLKPGLTSIAPPHDQEINAQFRHTLKSVENGFSNSVLLELSKSLIQVLSLINSKPTRHEFKRGKGRVERVISYMKSNLHQNLALPDLSSMADLSVPQFSQIFKHQTGVSPMVYFTELRMQKAGKLLDQTQIGVAEVANEMGFVDPLYFSRQFKKCTGLSPRKYRLRN